MLRAFISLMLVIHTKDQFRYGEAVGSAARPEVSRFRAKPLEEEFACVADNTGKSLPGLFERIEKCARI